MKPLISDTLGNAICEQIGHERYNANLYMCMCGFLRGMGLDNLAKHFKTQHDEETEHSMEFFNLLTDLNATVFIPEIAKITANFTSFKSLVTAYLDREILTTKSIAELKKLAVEEDNPVVEEKMRQMIAVQQKEYEEATTLLDKAELLPEWWQVALLDAAS